MFLSSALGGVRSDYNSRWYVTFDVPASQGYGSTDSTTHRHHHNRVVVTHPTQRVRMSNKHFAINIRRKKFSPIYRSQQFGRN